MEIGSQIAKILHNLIIILIIKKSAISFRLEKKEIDFLTFLNKWQYDKILLRLWIT